MKPTVREMTGAVLPAPVEKPTGPRRRLSSGKGASKSVR